MRLNHMPALVACGLLAACASSPEKQDAMSTDAGADAATMTRSADAGPQKSVEDFQSAARRNRAALTLPDWEKTPTEIERSVTESLNRADARLAELAGQEADAVTFDSTFAAMDDILWDVGNTANRMSVIKYTSPDSAMRDAATEQINRLNDWFVALQYREDLYEVARSFEELYNEGRRPRLRGEDLKLMNETMRDYRRAGLHLDELTRTRVEDLQKQLARLSTEFGTNISNARVPVEYTEDELDGVPQNFLDAARTDDGKYVFRATVTPNFLAIMENASDEETRKRMKVARYNTAKDANGPILDELVRLRDEIAALLGYDSWADYKTEIRMAGSGETALNFVNDMIEGLEPKFAAEVGAMRQMKIDDTGNPNASINIWDWRYFSNRIMKENYNIDTEALREYFPFDACVQGMFDIYGELFGLEFQRIEAPYVWHDSVELYACTDSRTGEPMGLFYFDMFPREGKYNHFAQFGITDGKRLDNGRYQRPVVALICNFTAPREDRPSLIAHNELETLFHEFGHALHSILTRANYANFSGTSVPRDFVEAPSQMLENWVWEPEVLNTFAGHYQDRSKKLDPALLDRMEEARLATIGTFYRRQLAFAKADLRLHAAGSYKNTREIVNETMAEVFFAPPEDTNFAAYWGHLTGYDAGYYGYAWADAIAADMATVFEEAPGGLMDKKIGMRLRNEIYSVGGGREIDDSIRAFLKRDRSLEPFLESIGIDAPAPNKSSKEN